MKKKNNNSVLGVMVNSRAVHAVLLQDGPDGLLMVRRLARQRTSRFAAEPSMAAGTMPGLEADNTADDFTLQIGDSGGGGADMFLSSEFGGLSGGFGEAEHEANPADAAFTLELDDLLAECRDAGYADPTVAFCLDTSDVAHVEVRVPVMKAGKPGANGAANSKPRGNGPVERAELLTLLAGQFQGEVDQERTAFLPMTAAEDGTARFLALVPQPNDPVTTTLRQLREQQGTFPTVRLLDTEVPLYLGLTRAALRPESEEEAEVLPEGNTLIVRSGPEDTLVMFLRGDTLQYCECLRSLTSYEAPETICSRVLLLQDEYGIGEVQHVRLLSYEKEKDLIESFRMFFPDAEVATLREGLERLGAGGSGEPDDGARVPAVAAALRLVDDGRYQDLFEEVNLLPKKLVRRPLRMPFSWQHLVFGLLAFLVVAFFAYQYVGVQREIDQVNDELRKYPPILAHEEPQALQARIDSLQGIVNRYVHALDVLDTLLLGSDQWSRALETTSREVSSVAGLWIEDWDPKTNHIRITGNATGRDRVVQFASRTGANIESLSFSEIREWPVYSFVMSIPLAEELPEAAYYLRAKATEMREAEAAADAAAEAAQNAPASN